MKRWLRAAMAVTLCALASTLALAGPDALPQFAQVRQAFRPSDLTLLDRHGQPLQTIRVNDQVRQLAWVPLQDMSPALLTAIVYSEDQRFWAHSGVDWRGVAASAWGNLWNERTRGASTVTMQLAGLLDASHARPQGGRSWGGKLAQAWSARALEQQWRKSEILEAYLNLVPLRGELVGLHALAHTLFGKHPSALDARESAIAAALVRGPNAAPAQVAHRACLVWQAMQKAPTKPTTRQLSKPLSKPAPAQEVMSASACPGLALLAQAVLKRQGGMPLGEQLAPHAARQVLAQARQAGLGRTAPNAHQSRQSLPWPASLQTTLDARIQRLAVSALRQQMAQLQGRQVEDGAVIVLDNASGEVLAWVGSAGTLASASEVDGVLARRQAGSTLKPFVYELAFERQLLTPASLLDDSPTQWPTAAGAYRPRNYDHRFRGWVSVRQALGSSLNIPAVRAGAMLGSEALAQRFNALGLGLRESGGFYGPGLALGSTEVTLRDLSNAYRALSQGGRWSAVRLLRAPPASTASKASSGVSSGASSEAKARATRRAMQVEAAFLTTDILADNNARAATFGLDSVLATRGFAAVKTGTSKDMRDNWCVGFTERYTVGVWVGNASGEPMHEVSGVAGAAPIWSQLVRQLHSDQPSRAPSPPPGVLAQQIHFQTPANPEPARQEWFIRGTQQAVWQVQPPPAARAIVQPQDGAIYAIDPDMPPRVQRVLFKQAQQAGAIAGGAGGAGSRSWWLDGRRLSNAAQHAWLPLPGRHQLQLRQGTRVLDSVSFEVRGATLKAQAPALAPAQFGPQSAPQRRRVAFLAGAGPER